MPREIIIIVAISDNNVIGINNNLPWYYPEDLKHFKALTTGKTIVMGKSTYESLPIKPLPSRRNVVISTSLNDPKIQIYRSIEQCLSEENTDLWIIGGQSIYEQFIAKATRLELTRIPGTFNGDKYFNVNLNHWTLIKETKLENNLRFQTYVKNTQ